ncbi:Uu.00g099540.m01.CDS01 [Anthostomella pinea]|uniref:Uu.00g099540.m01.CDS01 n=1 Tax=Anthostomella pinea TaxID=933095 RepID=A0AAI8YF81_9PEZI|nr:Uu.00g099540.m01.CDS01 [Anthostomella pinea]
MASFTALNGAEPKAPEVPAGSPPPRRLGSEERSAGQLPITSHEPKAGEPSLAPQREHWPAPSADRPPYPSISISYHPETEGTPHKRKRSDSFEHQRESSSAREREQHPQVESREAYATPQRERDYRHFGDDNREHHESWYSQQQHRDDRSPYEARNSAGSMPEQTDEQIGDALRRATSHMDSPREYSAISPDGDDSAFYSGYTPEQRRDAAIQSDPKKRKRNFSNRTKTGCLTCRKRKKKCDETKPECTNCVRGGFICQGYPNQRGYQKMESKPAAVPLESKDPSYIPPGAYGMPQPSHFPNPAAATAPASKRDSVPPYRGQPLRIEPPQGRTVLTDDDRLTASTIPTASVTSPENKFSSMSAYTNAANMFPTPISAVSSSIPPMSSVSATAMQLQTPLTAVDRPKEYGRVPPLHDLSRTDPDTPHSSSLPQINIFHPTRTTSPTSQPPPPPPTTTPQVAAQLALSHTQYTANKARTQKQEMLRGNPYYPFDPELVAERERCMASCWKFNNSTNPATGVSAGERARLFEKILSPQEPLNISPQLVSPVANIGRVGTGAVVEAPFMCDYGYNITIGNCVFIGRNCTIIDPMEISIGDNCYIGPNVSLFGGTLYTDPKKRQGSKSPHLGGTIIIDDDVWIGGGAIILPGRKVGKGATVAAGAVITRDVPPFTVVTGNPARVSRGANSS